MILWVTTDNAGDDSSDGPLSRVDLDGHITDSRWPESCLLHNNQLSGWACPPLSYFPFPLFRFECWLSSLWWLGLRNLRVKAILFFSLKSSWGWLLLSGWVKYPQPLPAILWSCVSLQPPNFPHPGHLIPRLLHISNPLSLRSMVSPTLNLLPTP